jgi:hypothetical protein
MLKSFLIKNKQTNKKPPALSTAHKSPHTVLSHRKAKLRHNVISRQAAPPHNFMPGAKTQHKPEYSREMIIQNHVSFPFSVPLNQCRALHGL